MFEPIDDDSARSHKNDCEMYVCPVAKGVQLKQADVENLDYIAPLMYRKYQLISSYRILSR
jgi:hypothetical protein